MSRSPNPKVGDTIKFTRFTGKVGYDKRLMHTLVDLLGEKGEIVYISDNGFHPYRIAFEVKEERIEEEFAEDEFIVV